MTDILQPLIDVAEALLVFFHDDVGFGWGAAIIALTVLVRLLILPLSLKQIRSMRALQALQPQLKEIQEKYKGDRQRIQQETMRFYQENKVNPLASCFPLLLQLPVFITLFYTLRSDSFEEDVLSSGDPGFLFIPSLVDAPSSVGETAALIILFVGTQMLAGLVTAAKIEGPQRYIVFGLPLVFAPFVASFPAGLSVYWITTNVWTLGQQFVVQKVAPPPEVPTVEEVKEAKPPPPPPRKRKRKRSGARR